jgi:hypothetical protein
MFVNFMDQKSQQAEITNFTLQACATGITVDHGIGKSSRATTQIKANHAALYPGHLGQKLVYP